MDIKEIGSYIYLYIYTYIYIYMSSPARNCGDARAPLCAYRVSSSDAAALPMPSPKCSRSATRKTATRPSTMHTLIYCHLNAGRPNRGTLEQGRATGDLFLYLDAPCGARTPPPADFVACVLLQLSLFRRLKNAMDSFKASVRYYKCSEVLCQFFAVILH